MYNDLFKFTPKFHVRTHIQKLERLGYDLGLDELYMKRDDLTDFLGNKTRHIKFLIAQLKSEGVNSVELSGPGNSNAVRIYCQAFKRVGMEVRVNITTDLKNANGRVIDQINMFGEGKVKISYDDNKNYCALGYVEASGEILEDLPDVEKIYLYSYDASWIGLSVGLFLHDLDAEIVAVKGPGAPYGKLNSEFDVRYMNKIYKSVEELTGCKVSNRNVELREIDKIYHYGMVKSLLNLEGILIDPVYTGRAMRALIQDAKTGKIKRKDRVLFIHTGGVLRNFQ